jgi:hypothetical protein
LSGYARTWSVYLEQAAQPSQPSLFDQGTKEERMAKRTTHERSETLINGKNVSSRSAAGIDAMRLRAGLAERSQPASSLLVRVAGAMPGPALGPVALNPSSVFFDFRQVFKLQEPSTCGLGSRSRLESAHVEWLQTPLLADKVVV